MDMKRKAELDRWMDLVAFARVALHGAKLISDQELHNLHERAITGEAVGIDGYFGLRARLALLETQHSSVIKERDYLLKERDRLRDTKWEGIAAIEAQRDAAVEEASTVRQGYARLMENLTIILRTLDFLDDGKGANTAVALSKRAAERIAELEKAVK